MNSRRVSSFRLKGHVGSSLLYDVSTVTFDSLQSFFTKTFDFAPFSYCFSSKILNPHFRYRSHGSELNNLESLLSNLFVPEYCSSISFQIMVPSCLPRQLVSRNTALNCTHYHLIMNHRYTHSVLQPSHQCEYIYH